MKFIANPDKLLFSIWISIMGYIFIFVKIILEQIIILYPLIFLWIAFSIFIIKRNYVEYTVQDEKIIIRYMRKIIEIKFNEIEYIVQYSSITNLLKEKKYEIRLKNRIDVHERLLEIENNSFNKWVLKNADNFKIIKRNFIE